MTTTDEFNTKAGSKVVITSSLNAMVRDTRRGLDAAAQADLAVITSAGGEARKAWAANYVKAAGGSMAASGSGFAASKPRM